MHLDLLFCIKVISVIGFIYIIIELTNKELGISDSQYCFFDSGDLDDAFANYDGLEDIVSRKR